MIAIIALVIQVLMVLVPSNQEASAVVIPPMPNHQPVVKESAVTMEQEWYEYEFMALLDYADEFTALFNSYETKRAKNGALMIRQGNSGSFKFAKKG